jgi:hypothetical protein
VLKRAAKPVSPTSRSVAPGDARYTFDYPAVAPTADITLDLVGTASTVSCVIPRSVLLQYR